MNTQAENIFESWKPDRFNRNSLYQKTIRTFTSSLIAGDVLDVGCGSRIFCDLSKAKSWTGLDISERMLSAIEFIDDVPQRKTLKGNVLELSFEDEAFDTVTAFFLLHHLGRNNRFDSSIRVQAAFNEIYRVLKPGGRFVMAENCRGFLEAPYHWCYSVCYSLGKILGKIELPFFWKAKHYCAFGEKAGFLQSLYVHIPIRENIYQPVLNISIPPVLSHDFIQKMTIFEFVKSRP